MNNSDTSTDITEWFSRTLETVEFVRSRVDARPQIGVLTGTGLGDITAPFDIDAAFDYEELPNFPVSTVQGHQGRLLFGTRQNKQAVIMQGRFHLYEGYSPLEVAFPIRVMKALGIELLIVTNASGGLNPSYEPGDIMAISDHINLTGENPLAGPNEDRWGVRFPDMSFAYDRTLSAGAEKFGTDAGLRVRKGVYAGLMGPSLETPAEVRYLKTIGADAVGFSTVMEVIAAVHAGMRTLGLSIITNIHTPENPVPATVESVIAVANKTAAGVGEIIAQTIDACEDNPRLGK